MGDPHCSAALIGLLDSDNPTVREWAAMALANLAIDGAIEALRRAHRACLRRATPPDWTEPAGFAGLSRNSATAALSSRRSPRAYAPPPRMTPPAGPRPTSPRSSTTSPTTPR
ncbi:HEAT repeat domain-containing protein [Streptomyces lydicus]|uniref:HEAT repeat domain-containing protein n=1 Tax=Streptomyces lydicus TaxID=47763 RepID=UPI00381A5561